MSEAFLFAVGDKVEKDYGHLRFCGIVRAAFHKRLGTAHYVVENDRGQIIILSGPGILRVPA